MKLTIPERIVALNLLPKEGSVTTLRALTKMRMQIAFSEEELRDLGITSDDASGRTSWKRNVEVDIPFGEKATDIMVEALRKLNDQKRLPMEALSLYEKFIPS